MSNPYPFGSPAMPPINIQNNLDKRLVGIAYSGGGDRVVIELGIVQAFIELGIVPDLIAGVSAGGFAGVFHALDPHSTQYMKVAMDAAARALPLLRPSRFIDIFRLLPAALEVLFFGTGALRLQSILSNRRVRALLERRLPVKTFGELRVPLSIAATNLLNGAETWFNDPQMALVPALMASAAIPVLFPPVQIAGRHYVDGSVADNLPLVRLAQMGCSVIYACNVGYAGETNKPPVNLIDTALQSISIGQYAAELRQELLLKAMYPQIQVIPVRPKVELATLPSAINPRDVARYVAEATAETKRILTQAGAPAQ